jgi:hypothetical protein
LNCRAICRGAVGVVAQWHVGVLLVSRSPG